MHLLYIHKPARQQQIQIPPLFSSSFSFIFLTVCSLKETHIWGEHAPDPDRTLDLLAVRHPCHRVAQHPILSTCLIAKLNVCTKCIKILLPTLKIVPLNNVIYNTHQVILTLYINFN